MFIYLWNKFIKQKKSKSSEYYTDYVYGKTAIRIFKPEFEYQAIGDLNPYSILDRGNFSQYYVWALIDLEHEKINNNGSKRYTRK
jgi:hypothetical protein